MDRKGQHSDRHDQEYCGDYQKKQQMLLLIPFRERRELDMEPGEIAEIDEETLDTHEDDWAQQQFHHGDDAGAQRDHIKAGEGGLAGHGNAP